MATRARHPSSVRPRLGVTEGLPVERGLGVRDFHEGEVAEHPERSARHFLGSGA
jgi:hypothetical protein